MAGSRTLKLSILADVDDLKKKLATANGDVESSSNKLGEFGEKAKLAFLAAAAAAATYAVKIGIDGVKSAIEDEQAQLRLANALKSATGATTDQIKATEDYITKTQLATGITDNDLRQSLQRLAVTTKDVSVSQNLLNLAIDISKGTGKELGTVTEALAKSYEGNDAKLARLGIGLSAADLKTLDFTQTTQKLADLYGGAASANAETFQGRMDRLKQAFDESKESLGYALLPIIERLVQYVTEFVVPIVERFANAIGGKEGLNGYFEKVVQTIKSIFIPVWDGVVFVFDKIKTTIDSNRENFEKFFDVVQYSAPILGKVLGTSLKIIGDVAGIVLDVISKVLGAIKPLLNTAIDGINMVIKGINLIKPGDDIPSIAKITSGTSTSASQFIPASQQTNPSISIPPIPTFTPTTITTPSALTSSTGTTPSAMKSVSDSVMNATVGLALEQSTKNALPTVQNYINVTGAIDPESTARQIIDLLNQSAARGTGGAGAFANLAV